MVRLAVRKKKNEAGQAVLLVIAAMSVFLLGAVGLAIDGSHLYAQRQAAQAAADASATAGIMSIFDGTNTGTNAFGSAAYNCSTDPADTSSYPTTPCVFARTNGFGSTATDTIFVEPNPAGVTVPNLDPATPSLLRVTTTRQVSMTLTKFVGLSSFNVSASAMAAIVDIVSPVPIIVTHPTMAGALDANGNTGIAITGGPQRSIQINSNGTNPAGSAFNPPSSGSVDLSHAGPNGTGGDFGTFGGPTSQPPAGQLSLGSTGHYLHSSPVLDPLAGVPEPSLAGLPVGTSGPCIAAHCGDCPAPGFAGAKPATCIEYTQGTYSSLDLTGISSAIFDPGVYYVKGGGFTMKNNTVAMCTSCASDPTTLKGMVIYDGGTTAASTSTGKFTIDTLTYAQLLGAGISDPAVAPVAPYYGILFFEKREAAAHVGNGTNGNHIIGAGNGCFSIIGTIYITNTLAIMKADPNHYQGVTYHGTPCTGVADVGEIIVSQLTLKGTGSVSMGLFPFGFLKVRQVALVN